MIEILPVVEGQGEVNSLAKFLHRMLQPTALRVRQPFRMSKPAILREDRIQKAVATHLLLRSSAPGLLLFMVDTDGTCPAEMARSFVGRVPGTPPEVSWLFVAVETEFESWLVLGNPAFNAQHVDGEVRNPANPKSIVKSWNDGRYSPSVDQEHFIKSVDLDLLRDRSKSFRRMESKLWGWVKTVS